MAYDSIFKLVEQLFLWYNYANFRLKGVCFYELYGIK